jgi:hypothetical protein
VGTAPAWGKIGLTTHISGTLAIVNGGTGATDAATARANLGAGTGNGSVTSVAAGSYLTGGTITTTGTLAVDAATANTAGKVVARDGSGNFSAGTITANLTGTASNATTAAALSATTWQRITGNTIDYGSYGSIGVSGTTNGYAGISFSGVSGTLMMSASATGFYYNNSTWRVYWDGSGNQINTGNVSAYASDERLKRNWRKIQDPVKVVREIGGWEFDWDLEECNKWGFFPPASDIGVSAQQTQKHVPSVVTPAPFDLDPIANTSKSGKDYLTVRYEGLVPVLLAAVDVQAGEISDMTARIAKLEALVAQLTKGIAP